MKQPAIKHQAPGVAELTPAHYCAMIKWIDRKSADWALTQDDVGNLLGGIPTRTYRDWLKKSQAETLEMLSRDVVERISLLLGIDKALALSAPEGFHNDFFIRPNTNPLFANTSIREYLLSNGSMLAMYNVRRYLNAQRG